MTIDELLKSVTPETYLNLKQAIETGRWPNGDKLTDRQRAHALQAVIAWEVRNVPEQARTGFIDRVSKKENEVCGSERSDEGAQVVIMGESRNPPRT